MIFSKLARSIARSSSPRGWVYNGGLRSVTLHEGKLQALPGLETGVIQVDGGLGFMRQQFASLAARKGLITSDSGGVLANPRIRRVFSSEAPKKKKNDEKSCKKKSKQPPKKEEKSKSNGDFKKNLDESFDYILDNPDPDMRILWFSLTMALYIPLLYLMLDTHEPMQISFQEFKNKLLEPGLVDHIVISDKSVAKIYERRSRRNQRTEDPGIRHKHYINIGSIETFEEKLKEAQEALGIDPHDYVPVTYDVLASTSRVSDETSLIYNIKRSHP